MTTTLAVANQKGGVAKTTSAITFGHGLAISGRRVLLVDLDPQGNTADALGLPKESRLYEFLVNGAGKKVITSSQYPNLDVIVGDKNTDRAIRWLSSLDLGRERELRKRLQEIRDLYDVIILDVAPSVGLMQYNALVASDILVVPTTLTRLSLVGLYAVLESAKSLRAHKIPCARLAGVMPTMWSRTTVETRKQLAILKEAFSTETRWVPIPQDVKVEEAAAHGASIYAYAPRCRALDGTKVIIKDKEGKEIGKHLVGGYRRAVARLIQELEPS